jgi:hypothetical protein
MTKAQQAAARAYIAASPVKPTRQGIAAVRRELEGEPDSSPLNRDRDAGGLDAGSIRAHGRSMSPRVRAVLDRAIGRSVDSR